MNVKQIMKKLTLEQKCALLSGKDVFKTRDFKRAGIPSAWLSDGPHGLRKQAGPSDHLGLNPSEKATCFPTAATAACSWDVALGEEIGNALGEEAAAQGVNVVLGPGLNMKRNPLCGRNFEYFSEDPFLAGKLAAAYIRGIQKNGIGACPKHFAVNNQETRRMASDSIVDERTLREIYLTGFEIAVKEGRPKTIMTSYNQINGEYANENKHLLQEILRADWGYQGMAVTDWGCSNDHVLGVKMGSALEMPAPGLDSARELLEAVTSGKITEKDVDARVEELLKMVFSTNEAFEKKTGCVNYKKHHDLAQKAAARSLTLLKNEDQILPIKKGTKVALIGDFASVPRYQGAGSSVVNVTRLDNLLDCMKKSELNLIGFAKGFDRSGKKNEGLENEAVRLAEKAELVVLCLGLDEMQESEGLDRANMKMKQNQISLLKKINRINDNLAVVLFAGSAVETSWRKSCKGLLYAGLGGQAGAGAVMDVLTGKVNPGGKLAETWPEHYEDTPSVRHFAGRGHTVEYREGLYIGYRYYQKAKVKTAFPFGYGLSYTTFAYSDLKADKEKVTFCIKNTGTCDGSEIAQLYISSPGKEAFAPVRELKGFARVDLKAGESREVTIHLDDKAFRYWNVKTNRWETEGGAYTIYVGSNSENHPLSAVIEVESSGAPAPYTGKRLKHYEKGIVQNVPDEEFAALLGYPIPENKSRIDRNMTIGELNHGRSPVGWIIWLAVTCMLNRSKKRGQPDLNLLFMYNMPLRAIAKMTNGMVSMGMVDGMVLELKGFWLIGILKIGIEFLKNRYLNKAMEKRIGQ
jgi:beta-glucosidase